MRKREAFERALQQEGAALIDVYALAALHGVHPATVWRGVATGKFRKPIRVAGNLPGWIRAEEEAAIEAKRTARDNAEAA